MKNFTCLRNWKRDCFEENDHLNTCSLAGEHTQKKNQSRVKDNSSHRDIKLVFLVIPMPYMNPHLNQSWSYSNNSPVADKNYGWTRSRIQTDYIPTNSSVMLSPRNALEHGTQIIQHLDKACSYFLLNLFCKIAVNSVNTHTFTKNSLPWVFILAIWNNHNTCKVW